MAVETTAEEWIEELTREKPQGKHGGWYGLKLEDTEAGAKILTLDREAQARLVAELVPRMMLFDRAAEAHRATCTSSPDAEWKASWVALWTPRHYGELVLHGLLRRKLPLLEEVVVGLLEWIAEAELPSTLPLAGIASAAESIAGAIGMDDRRRLALIRAASKLRKETYDPTCRKVADRLEALTSDGPQVTLDPGEAWSDAALADLAAMAADKNRRWRELLAHCQKASGGKPTAKWLKAAGPFVEAVGHEALKAHLRRWLPLVDRPRTRPIEREHAWETDENQLIRPAHVELLKGLAWCAGLTEDRDMARALTVLALSAYRKVPRRGPRLVTLGNACVSALGMMPGTEAVGQLALLKVKIKFGTAQKEVEKALNAAATRAGIPREEIEELGVPAYGLDAVGRRREAFGDYTADLVIEDSDVSLRWSKADGKALKSIPAAVKKDHAEDVKELQAAAKDVGKMLAAQCERIDNLFLARKSWPVDAWRERYLDHPLVGTIARRLIWQFTADGRTAAGAWHDGQILGRDGQPLGEFATGTTVSLWHPIGHPAEDVLAWRAWLEGREVRQPTKQAHREVYVLTDAERRTGVYSNRFAAHVLRQHQYNALCAARGWKNQLRLGVDASYPPTALHLPQWGLRAEFWVEAAGEDMNEAGTYLYLATDQVRFYPEGAAGRTAHAGGGGYTADRGRPDEPTPLVDVPALVLSEVLRDVDLFVGVASVGNDPRWADGGPNGRYLDYWREYSFGDLSATAQTRKAVLQRLIPRLKIAGRCSFADRFLVVRGDLRTYKIHLGSGNILMEPNDQYLCIVAKQGGDAAGTPMFLPFEGDSTLSVVLSKALLLADDAKINDPTITSQIGRAS